MLSVPDMDHARHESAQPVPLWDNSPVYGLGAMNAIVDGWGEVIRTISTMHTLEDNWDDEGAAAPLHSTIQSAIKVAQKFCGDYYKSPNRCSATPAGTILFEWFGETDYLECEVYSPDSVECTHRDAQGRYTHFEVKLPPRIPCRLPSIN